MCITRNLPVGTMRGCFMKKILFLTAVLLFGWNVYAESPDSENSPKASFREIWAYLMPGEEAGIKGGEPITDLCYFAGELSYKCELVVKAKFPADAKIPAGARTHFVVADIRNMGRIYFLTNPDLPFRKKFIKDITEVAKDYNGIQIDFESVHPNDRAQFYAFLTDLKKALGDKTLSIAVPARVKKYENDSFNYKELSQIVDRIFIMAYDEHWSGSRPGPVASYDWCDKVSEYAVSVIPKDRLVMGIPFYGRSWQDKKHDRALRFSTAQNLIKENTDDMVPLKGSDPGFEFEDSVKVTVYYETPDSIMKKAHIYQSDGIQGIGFWRVGQESREIWDILSKGDPEEKK